MTLLQSLRRTLRAGAGRPARFQLVYAEPDTAPVTVGYLRFDGRAWTFMYSDEYKRRPDLRPIEGMDDLDKAYQSTVLFPFFAVRIPDADRKDIRQRLEAERVSDPEPADLLRMFGRRVVSSPTFELLPA